MTDHDLDHRRAERQRTRVGSAHARSWQLVSALRTDDFETAHLGRADQIILDMEDAIDDTLKDVARANVLEWLSTGGRAWVRVNDVTTPFWSDDLTLLATAPGVEGVMLAKTESAEQVSVTHQRLGGKIPVIPLVESALGIESSVDIARATGAHRLAFGSGDYRKDTGTANEAVAMAYPRTRLTLASRIGGLTGPIDGPTVGTTHALLREQAENAVVLGMTGKLCLDHEQPGVINEEFSPSPADVAWAVDFLAKFEADGRVIRDGSYKPRLARAELITRRASFFNVAAS